MVGLKEIQWHVVCSTKIILVTVENGLYEAKAWPLQWSKKERMVGPSLVTVRD